MHARLHVLAYLIGSLTGWRRNALAFFLGILATLTLAPFFLFPLIIPAFTGLFWLIDAAPTRKRAFADGWWWGWGFYISGLYWFCIALMTDPEKFAWLIPFALFALTGVIALYTAIACFFIHAFKVRGLTKIYVFSAVWLGVECARGDLFTGFPWNLAGYAFGFSDAAMQTASLVGVYGLTWFTVLLGLTLAMVLCGARGVRVAIAVWAIFAGAMLWGNGRLQASKMADDYVEGVTLRLVQANILQPHKWDPELQMQGIREHARLTNEPGIEKVTHVIWPETAVPYAIEPGSPLARDLGAAIPPGKILITGSLRTEGEKDTFRIWNSLMALNHDGSIVGSYDKVKLVPFGEFLPFRSLFPKEWLTPVGDTDFSHGERVQGLEWPGLPPLLPLICYEAIFPDFASAQNGNPQLLLNVTNDAWFGMSSGPHQHFEMARMRAVEQGIPLVRVANTGISAVVDSFGRVTALINLGEKAYTDAKLPKAQPHQTVYGLYNGLFIQIVLVLGLLLIFRQYIPQKN